MRPTCWWRCSEALLLSLEDRLFVVVYAGANTSRCCLFPFFLQRSGRAKTLRFPERIYIQTADSRWHRIAAQSQSEFSRSVPLGAFSRPRLRRPTLYATVPTSSLHASTVITSLSLFSVAAIEAARAIRLH